MAEKSDSAGTPEKTVVVIGSGFGGTMTALALAREFQNRGKKETILLLERGTWWTTPVGTVQDKEVATAAFLRDEKGQPVQFWPSVEHFKGFIDIFLRCVRRPKNEDGLYDVTTFGKRGFLGIGAQNDGVSILRASGVGGGSLVYSNVTIQPPDLIFDDARWPTTWDIKTRNDYYDLARTAIGTGVVYALEQRRPSSVSAMTPLNDLKVNAGLSNIATRSARLDPHWPVDSSGKTAKRINVNPTDMDPDPQNALWIDRARIFQSTMKKLTLDFGTVDSSINDLPSEPNPFNSGKKPANYCERQGRCNVGCLPGARHTLNKQLQAAILGKPGGIKPLFENITLEPLAEVDVIRALPEGGYVVEYAQRDQERPWITTPAQVKAAKVVVAAGCVGTNELLLRSKARGGLSKLSDKVGFGFSTNGDYVAFLEDTPTQISLTRGPVTTSYAHFNTAQAGGQSAQFHTIEDQGVPRALASVVGFGTPLLRSLAGGRNPKLIIILALLRWLVQRSVKMVVAFFRNAAERQDAFKSEDELTAKMMCIAAMGREAAVGQFRLGTAAGETDLRVARTDGLPFYKDPIYTSIQASLKAFAKELTGDSKRDFLNPFLTPAADALGGKAITLSHPLGGCRMARSAKEGVVDEFGRVFDKTRTDSHPFYDGLYAADAAIIPTSLGVNPSLTISALALRIADKMVEELTN